jgi:uncharacterized membrane protein
MSKFTSWLWGLGLGAGMMYFLDPNQGSRRRSLMQDQITSMKNSADDSIDVAMRDLNNRVRGVRAELAGAVSGGTPSDWVIKERVRARLGYLTHHPRAVEVDVHNGVVYLRGDALMSELDSLLTGVSNVNGVNRVENHLNVYESDEHVPSLQGTDQSRRASETSSSLWSPSTRLLAGGGGLFMILWGNMRRGLIGRVITMAGWGTLLRSLTNLPVKNLFGQTEERRVINVQRSMRFQVPVEKIYSFWSNFENFQHVMPHVKEVRKTGNNLYHWVAEGPVGIPIEWDARVTEQEENQVIAWESTKDSQLPTSGRVNFKAVDDNTTQVDFHLFYNPPAGAFGHAVASLFGTDPESDMIDLFVRLKSLMTEGKTTVKGKKLTLEGDIVRGE